MEKEISVEGNTKLKGVELTRIKMDGAVIIKLYDYIAQIWKQDFRKVISFAEF